MRKRYITLLKGIEQVIEIERMESNRFRVRIDGSDHEVDAWMCGSDQLSLLIDHRSYDISYSYEGDLVELQFQNQNFAVEVIDERKQRMRRVRPMIKSTGREIITTSMPGRVVKVLVAEGEEIEAGTDVIILEAMKMEMRIHCHHGGKVSAVRVKAGQAVESKTELLIIEAGSG